LPLSFEEEIYYQVSQREAKPLLHNDSFFPLLRGRGIKGDGVPGENLKRVRLITNLNKSKI